MPFPKPFFDILLRYFAVLFCQINTPIDFFNTCDNDGGYLPIHSRPATLPEVTALLLKDPLLHRVKRMMTKSIYRRESVDRPS